MPYYEVPNKKKSNIPMEIELSWFVVENGVFVCGANGNNYAGCSCNPSYALSRTCTKRQAEKCVKEIYDKLSDEDKKKLNYAIPKIPEKVHIAEVVLRKEALRKALEQYDIELNEKQLETLSFFWTEFIDNVYFYMEHFSLSEKLDMLKNKT